MYMGKRGITLVELMVSLSLLVVVLGIGYSFYSLGNKSFDIGEEKANVQQNVRLAFDIITKEIRYATELTILESVPNSFDAGYNYIYLDNNKAIIHRDDQSPPNIKNILEVTSTGLEFNLLFERHGEEKAEGKIVYFKIEESETNYHIETDVYIENLGQSTINGNSGLVVKYRKPKMNIDTGIPGPGEDDIEEIPGTEDDDCGCGC